MATYHFKSTDELAQFLMVRAYQLDEHLKRQILQGASKGAQKLTERERGAWLTAAAIVKDSEITLDK